MESKGPLKKTKSSSYYQILGENFRFEIIIIKAFLENSLNQIRKGRHWLQALFNDPQALTLLSYPKIIPGIQSGQFPPPLRKPFGGSFHFDGGLQLLLLHCLLRRLLLTLPLKTITKALS
jgi:hypothetical protein